MTTGSEPHRWQHIVQHARRGVYGPSAFRATSPEQRRRWFVDRPDGTHVAVILSKSGSPDLWVANIDGSGLRQLTKTLEPESSPCWSPDGQHICYVSSEDGPARLYRIGANGGTPPPRRASSIISRASLRAIASVHDGRS